MIDSSRVLYRLNGDDINPEDLCDRGKELLRLLASSSEEIKALELRLKLIKAGQEYLMQELTPILSLAKRSSSEAPFVQGRASPTIPETISDSLTETPPSIIDVIPASLRI